MLLPELSLFLVTDSIGGNGSIGGCNGNGSIAATEGSMGAAAEDRPSSLPPLVEDFD